jgi:type IV secretory pathway TraG/TraD family ATPase VirD4
MSSGSSTNAGLQGYGILVADFRTRAKLWSRVLVLSLVFYLLTFVCLVWKEIPPWALETYWKFQVARLFLGFPVEPRFNVAGWRCTTRQFLRDKNCRLIVATVRGKFVRFSKLAGAAIPVTFVVVWFILRRKARRLTRAEHIRGMRLITEKELARQVRKQAGLLTFGRVALPSIYEGEHVMIAGKTQVGKTVTLMQQLWAIREAGFPAIVYDFKGEYVEKFYRPGIDHLANPLDGRGIRWNIFDDIETIPDISALAGSLIPPGAGEEHFWCAAAQAVLIGVIAALLKEGKRTGEDLWKALSAPTVEIARLCASTEQGAAGLKYIEEAHSKQANIVVSVLMTYVSWLEFACNGSGFSIRKWIADPGGSFIFITGRPEVENTLRPYISLLIDLLGKRFLSSSDDRARRIYFVLDEFGNLQKLPTIKRLLTAGGSKGATVLLGFQDFAAIVKTYGREDAETILNSCGTSLVLKLSDETTARIFSGRFGETQDWQVTETRTLGQGKTQASSSFSRSIRTDRLILPSEIQSLKKLVGYLLIPEHEPAKIMLRIAAANQLPAANRAFTLRPGLSLDDIQAREVVIEARKKEALAGFAAPTAKAVAPMEDGEY